MEELDTKDKVYQLNHSHIGQLISQVSKTIKLQVTELKNILIVGSIILGLIIYFMYDLNKQVKTEILNTNMKIDLVLGQNTYMTKNMTALAGTICYNCHNNIKMFLPKTTLKLEEFVKYVRGDRFVTNSVMPVLTEKDISYEKLQEIWKTLY